jgi:hypothetical protein
MAVAQIIRMPLSCVCPRRKNIACESGPIPRVDHMLSPAAHQLRLKSEIEKIKEALKNIDFGMNFI